MNKRYKSLLNVLKEFDMDTEEYRQMALVLAEKLNKQEFTSLFSFLFRLKLREQAHSAKLQTLIKESTTPKKRRGRPSKNDLES
jgi:hypothetical protein